MFYNLTYHTHDTVCVKAESKEEAKRIFLSQTMDEYVDIEYIEEDECYYEGKEYLGDADDNWRSK